MKIESVEALLVGEWPLVRIRTDTGLSGVGEGTFWAHPPATAAVVDSFESYLVGRDPLTIDLHWQYLYRYSSFRSASISSALSAVDTALWDIAGKHYGAPIHSLLGGRHRDRIRLCALCQSDTVENAARSTAAAVAAGHTAVKISPTPPDFSRLSQARLIRESVARVAAVRDAVGPDVDIGVEVHRNMSPAQAVMLAEKLEPFDILFLEDPIQPDSVQSMADVASRVRVPIATGERFNSLFEFREVLELQAARDIKLDVGLHGGFTQCKKAAGIAEAYHATVSPHNARGPVLLAAHVQLCAAIPNFLVLEYRMDDRYDIASPAFNVKDGYLPVPDAPGLGIELDDDAVAKYPYAARDLDTPRRADGSVGFV